MSVPHFVPPSTDASLPHPLYPGLVAVHCTHGLNRTGYLICRSTYTYTTSTTHTLLCIYALSAVWWFRYLMERCGYDAETAITGNIKYRVTLYRVWCSCVQPSTRVEVPTLSGKTSSNTSGMGELLALGLSKFRNRVSGVESSQPTICRCPKDETRKSPAPSRQPARREDLIPARREDVVSSSSSSHHGHWTSGRGRRRDEVRDRSRRHKRNDDPVRWEGDLRSRLGQRADHRERETREVYREYRRDGDSGGGGVRGRLGKRGVFVFILCSAAVGIFSTLYFARRF